MAKRPTSVTAVCWILIASEGISLIFSIWILANPNPTAKQMATELMSRSPIPISVQYLQMHAGFLIGVVSGIAMLRGRNWGRLLYIGWRVLGYIFDFVAYPMSMGIIPGLVVFIVFTVILFQPKANEYFSAGPPENDVWPTFMFRAVNMRKVSSIICYILAGAFFAGASRLASMSVPSITSEYFTIFKCFMIALALFPAFLLLLFALWLTRFHKWKDYAGIVLLSASGVSAFEMLSSFFWVVPPELEKYVPAGAKAFSTDYLTGTVYILALGLIGVFLVISGRKATLGQSSGQSWFRDKDATGFRSTGNEWKVIENIQSEPKPQSHDQLSVRGVSILGFKPNSRAREAGLINGDVIIEYDGAGNLTTDTLADLTAKKGQQGTPARVVFLRGGQEHSIVVSPGSLGISVLDTSVHSLSGHHSSE